MKFTRFLALFLALLVLLSSFVSCTKPVTPEPSNTGTNTEDQQQNNNTNDEQQNTEPSLVITYETSVKSTNIHTILQNEYLKSKQYDTPTSAMNGSGESSRPSPITLKWTRHVEGKYQKPTETAVISKTEDFADPIRITSTNSQVEIDNLELGASFYWYVEGRVGDNVFKSEVSKVTVDLAAPRNLYVSGVTNCRDLGGWTATDGTVLTQGQIFRTGRFSSIDSEGKDFLLKDLGIKTEIDLRNEEQLIKQDKTIESKLGNKVNYVYAPMEWENLGSGKNILTAPVNEESLLKVFEVFGDEKNYPIVFHCSIGTDRTGLIAFLILGLCGVSEKDLYRDFLFSGFGKIDKTPEVGRLTGFLNTVKEASGKTLAEKIENYLLSRGVTAAQIATIRKMMK